MIRWRGADKKQLAGRLQGYCGRPASSLGMAGTGGGSLVASPSIRYNRTRRSSMSYYEENRQSSQYNLQVSDNWRASNPRCENLVLYRLLGGLEPQAT